MITHIGGARTDRSLFGVTFHEIGHMYFPMIIGQDEKAFTWMDEGLSFSIPPKHPPNSGIKIRGTLGSKGIIRSQEWEMKSNRCVTEISIRWEGQPVDWPHTTSPLSHYTHFGQ